MLAHHPLNRTRKAGDFQLLEHQASVNHGKRKVCSVRFINDPASNALVSGTTWKGKFHTNDVSGRVEQANLMVEITENGTSNAYFTASPYFVNEMRVRVPGASGSDVIQTAYGDTLFWENCALVSQDKQNLRDLNVMESYNRTRIHKSAKIREYRIRLISNPFSMNHLAINQVRGEMELEVDFSTGITASGSGVPTISGVRLEFITSEPDPREGQMIAESFHKTKLTKYLDVIQAKYTSQTLTASTNYDMNLDAFADRDIAFILFGVRSDSYSASSNSNLKLHDLSGGRVDLVNSAGQPVFGNGSDLVPVDLLKDEIMTPMINNADFVSQKNWYVLPFCRDIAKAFHGVKDGYHTIERNSKLRIQPRSAGVSCVQTITLNNPANDGGYYRLSFRGYSTNSLIYSTSAANIKVALEALPSFQDWYGQQLTVTASGSATATLTLTFPANLEPPNDDLVILHSDSLNDGTVADFGVSTVSTVGEKGWTTASTYTVDAYAYYFRNMVVKSGRIAVSDSRN